MPNWVDLSRDLLEMIFDNCFPPDHVRMQLVCKLWRSIFSMRRHELPWLMMHPNKEEEEHHHPDARNFFNLSKQKIHTICIPEIHGKRCCGSFQNGLIMTMDMKLDISLFHPWSRIQIPLPHPSTLKCIPLLPIFNHSIEIIVRDLICKAALSDDGNMVVIMYNDGYMAFCRIGDEAWTNIKSAFHVEDVINHKGQFYVLSQYVGVHILHIEDGFNPSFERISEDLEPKPSWSIYYLVPDTLTDSMFVILRRAKDDEKDHLHTCTIRFDVYGISLKKEGKLMKVESLGDRILFLGYNSPMIVLAGQFPECKGNCIYFAENSLSSSYDCVPYVGVFNLEDGTIEELFADRSHPTLSPPLWIATPP